MNLMDCKPAYKDLDWRAYLRTIQKGLHSATASRTAAILESVPCWWGIGQISAGLRHHWGPKFRFDWFDGGAQFSNGSYGAWAKVTRPSASEVRSNPTFSLDTCSCSWIEKSPENGAMGLFSGRSQAYWFFRQVRWKGLSVEQKRRIAWDVFHVSYTWQPRFFGFCLLIFRSHFTLLVNCAKSLTSTDSSIGSARAKKILYFVWSPPWHLYIFLLANLLAFYLTYLLTYLLAFYLAFYLAYLLTYILTYLLAFYLAFYLAYLLAYVLAYLLAYLPAFYLAFYLAYLLAYVLAYLLAYLLAFYLASYLAYYLTNLLGFYLAYLVAFYLTFYLAFYLAYLLAFHLAYLLAFYLAYLLAFYLAVEVQRCTLSWAGPRLRSSGAHWAGQLAGWGPAVHTELGSSQVEVQRCTLSWAARRLTSSSAHWAGKLAKSWQGWQGGSGGGRGGGS